MVEFIYLARNSELKKFEVEGTETYLANLSKFNIFIGPNNSGKSRVIRSIFKLGNDLKANAHPINWAETRKNTIQIINLFEDIFITDFSKNAATFLETKKLNKIKDNIQKNELTPDIFSVCELKTLINSLSAENYEGNIGYFNINAKIRKDELNQYFHSFVGYQPINSNQTYREYRFLYIPVLRGLRPIQLNSKSFSNEDNYTKRTLYDYFDKSSERSHVFLQNKSSIFSGLSLYQEIKKLLLGSEEERKLIAAFEKFLSQYIFEKSVTLIPKYNDDVLHIKIGNSPQLEVYNLGDGIQALITLLFPIFIHKEEDALIFIEEPEIHLHPHWQRRFIEAVNQFENHQFFLTTHSNVFINLPNSSIFKVRTEKEKDKTFITYLNLREEKIEVLDELGYKASDLLQTNFILWVEGPSDMIYFNYWISIVR